MNEQVTTSELTPDSSSCAVDGACTSCSSCSTGLCPGILIAAVIVLLWTGANIGTKLFGRKSPTDDA